MANTGMQRSLTVKINKLLAGVQQEGYPRTYQGRNAFSFGGVNFYEIDANRMATMPTVEFNIRLAAFKNYVESQEAGLSFISDTVQGADAYQENLTACPI